MSTKSKIIHVRVEPSLKKDAEAVLKNLGVSSGEAIRLFFTQIVLKKEIPFPIDLETGDKNENYTEVKNEAHLKELIGL